MSEKKSKSKKKLDDKLDLFRVDITVKRTDDFEEFIVSLDRAVSKVRIEILEEVAKKRGVKLKYTH